MLAFSVAGLVECDVGSFAIELDVLCLLLADHDRVLEMHVQDDDQFEDRWLEEQVLDVAESDVDFTPSNVMVA